MSPGRTSFARRYREDWGRAILAVGVVAVLVCLAVANAVVRADWREVEDGVLWREGPGGLVADVVAAGSAAASAGIAPGDILLAIDGVPVERTGEILRVHHAGAPGTRLTYDILRLGDRRIYRVALEPTPSAAPGVYFPLAATGLIGLIIGAAVRVRRPDHQATLHFFWLTVAFFGVFAFSYTGRLDRLDQVFFWADEVAILLLAPLFAHFALVFPERARGWFHGAAGWVILPLIYAPAAGLGVMQAVAMAGSGSDAGFMQAVERVWRLEHLYLVACTLGGLAAMVAALRRVRSVTSRRQLRWIVSGAMLGGAPFAFGYGLPYAIGFTPAAGLELTALSLGLIPFAFASAIVHYRLRDVEVIVKRSVVHAAAVAAMIVIYVALERLAAAVFLDGTDRSTVVIALLATAVVVLLARPVTNAIRTMLDRAHYRDRFDYRRALVRFARDLNRDLDIDRLSERLVSRVMETLEIDRMILLLGGPAAADDRGIRERREDGAARQPDPRRGGLDFQPIRWAGFDTAPPALARASTVGARVTARHAVLLDDPAGHRTCAAADVAFWRTRGIDYFVPCVSGDDVIAVMALGGKASGEPLSSEDMALVAAVAAQVATALENGRLYGELRRKAGELDRMRQFSENVVESLGDGLVVLDVDDRVVRWNAGMERLYGVSRTEALGQPIAALFDPGFVDRVRTARHDRPAGAELYRTPLVCRDADRRRLLVNAATAPVLTPGGETAGTLLIVEDATARVRLEEQLQLSEKMASIGLLAAGVAHEVNTPLTGISSFTQMLLEGADPADDRTRLLEKIEQQTFRAARIVNGLLNLSRPGESDAAAPVDVNAVIGDVLVLLEHQLERGRVTVRRELSTPSPIVTGIEFKLQQVFLNLFLNARDAMPTGGWLTVRTRVDDGRAVVDVDDTGSGIAPEHLSRIYDPFFTTKDVGRGTGLGLSITYGVVQDHEGTIECASRPGHGTRFTLALPLAAPDRVLASEAAR